MTEPTPVETECTPPNLALGPLKIWVHGYQFPECNDYHDGNWLNATAVCDSGDAKVRCFGPFITAPELNGWAKDVRKLSQSLEGVAELHCLEPQLRVVLKAASRGGLLMTVHITPDPMREKHEFQIGLDQSYLSEFLVGCSDVLQRFPVRGTPGYHLKRLIRHFTKS